MKDKNSTSGFRKETKEGVEEGVDKRRFDFPPFWQIDVVDLQCEGGFSNTSFLKGLNWEYYTFVKRK